MAVEQCWELRLIEEVRRRPQLWDSREIMESGDRSDALWNEIGQVLNVEAHTCQITWEKLRSQFCSEVESIKKRIEKDKAAGLYHPNKKYCCLPYFDHLRFQANDIETTVTTDNKIKTEPGLLDSNSVQTESNNDVEMKESDYLDQTANEFRIIEEVRKRSAIWKFKQEQAGVNNSVALWAEIGQVLDIDVIACKNIWTRLCTNFWHERALVRQRIARAKKAGSYDATKNYSKWLFFDALRFIEGGFSQKVKPTPKAMESTNADQTKYYLFDNNSLEAETNNDGEMMEGDNLAGKALDKCQLIEEVRKRPLLWDYRLVSQKSRAKCDKLWNEIAHVFSTEVYICKQTWKNLRAHFHGEVASIKNRIAKEKRAGSYDPKKKYYTWTFFDNLRFLADGRSPKANIDLSFEQNPDIETVANNSDLTPGNKFRLIEEVRKRPALWDFKHEEKGLNNAAALWKEIAQTLDVDVTTCKQVWKKLRANFRCEAYRVAERIEKAKKEGSYDPNKKYYFWMFFDGLRFLANGLSPAAQVDLKIFENNNNIEETNPDLFDSNSLQTESDDGTEASTTVDKLLLIQEVKKRPPLWDLKLGLDKCKRNRLWREIGQILGANAKTCKETFARLRVHFRIEASRRSIRIARAKKEGSYDPNNKYCLWSFFDALLFLANGLSPRSKIDRKILASNNNGSDSLQTENNIDMDNAESEHDSEFNEHDNSVQNASLVEDYFENDYDVKESEYEKNSNRNTVLQIDAVVKQEPELQIESERYTITPVDDSDFLTPEYTNSVSKGSCVQQDTDCATVSNYNSVLQTDVVVKQEPDLLNESEKYTITPVDDSNGLKSVHTNSESYTTFSVSSTDSASVSNYNTVQRVDAVVKQEPELKIKTEKDPLENEEFSENSTSTVVTKENELNDWEEFANYVKSEHHNTLTSPNLNDHDYVFLCSFLSQTKAMTPAQKMTFHLNMQKLLADTFPSSTSVNILEKQLLLPEDHDPDRKLLISFWPFIQSLPQLQNLQFRLKMLEVLNKTFATVAN